jgi:diguanylate cyclase (GGDEF)-like protein/PAS domain S-box-containing protein
MSQSFFSRIAMTESAELLNILAVDDDPSSARDIEAAVNDPLLRFHFADTANALSRTIEAQPIDLAVMHIHDGSEPLLDPLMRVVRAASPPIALIALVAPEAEAALGAASCGVNGCARIDDPEAIQRIVRERAAHIRRQRSQAQALERSRDIHERYNLLLESSREAIAYLHEGLHIYANPSYLELFGYPDFEAIEGFSILDLLSSPDGTQDIKQLLRSLSRGELPTDTLEFLAHRSNGAEFRASADFSPAHYEGEACTQIMVRERVEATGSAELQEEIEKLRSRDLLTGLLNRQAFIGKLRNEIEQPPDDRHLAILLVAVDDQEAIQQKVGASATDVIVRQCSEAFREVVEEDMLPARLSDHVLAARIRFADREEAASMATRLVENFSGRILEIRDKSPSITASVGLAVGGSQHFSADELLSQAESALREAQRAGGNSYMRYRPGSAATEDGDLDEWAERLRHALNNGDFRLVRLPITSMEDDSFTISEFETRLREEGSDEIILPSTFQPAANASGLAAALDRDLIESLIRWCGNNPDADSEMLVPLSMQSLTDPEFSEELQQLVDDGTLASRKLILGFQESEAREDLRGLQRLVSRLGARGVRFALLGVLPESKIDLVLKNVHVDYLKLGGDLSSALRTGDQQHAALERLVAEAAANEAQVIAPQVENTSDLAALFHFGITLVQDDFVRDEE